MRLITDVAANEVYAVNSRVVWDYCYTDEQAYGITERNLTFCTSSDMLLQNVDTDILRQLIFFNSTRWRSWLRHCATSRKVAGSIPDGVIGIFH